MYMLPTQQDVTVVHGRDVQLPVPDGAIGDARQAAENEEAHQPCRAAEHILMHRIHACRRQRVLLDVMLS